jgi:hypothetical protein
MKQFIISTILFLAVTTTLATLEAMPTPDLMSPLVKAFETLFNLIQ